MDQRRQELKSLKRTQRNIRKKYVAPWKTLCLLSAILALLSAPVCMVVQCLDNGVAAQLGGTFWRLKKPDGNATYFQKDFSTSEELEVHIRQLNKELATESVVLLKNENNALPLVTGSEVGCFFGPSAAPLLYGERTLNAALQAAELPVNEALLHLYEDKNAMEDGAVPQYSQQLLNTVTDTAVVIGEDAGILETLCQRRAAGSLRKLVVLLTDSNPQWQDLYHGVDSVLWIGAVKDGDALAELLTGKVSPSGRLADTLCNEGIQTPIPLSYGENLGEYILCREGIYTGYRYYETRYEDFVMGAGNPGNYAYSGAVRYPFGYGLSYTDFAYSDFDVIYDDKADQYEVTVTVTNTGTVAAKETVQVYAQTPYTQYDKENLVEKPALSLVGFGKTATLAPGARETVTVTVDRRTLAAYDANAAKTYILDAGAYYFTVASDVHKAMNNILTVKGYSPETTENRMDCLGDATLTYQWTQVEPDTKTYATTKNSVAITNCLSSADPNHYEGVQEQVTWLSRQDWEGTSQKITAQFLLTDTLRADLQKQYNPADHPAATMPTLGAKNGLTLYEMIGLSYTDPQWQTLLDQLTFVEMAALIGDSYGYQLPVASVEAPGLKKAAAEDLAKEKATATTFNQELLTAVGKALGNQCLEEGIGYLRLSAVETEDSLLSGKLTAAQVSGLREKGIVTVIGGVGAQSPMWLNEQTARQQYLLRLQYAAELGAGVVISDMRLGTDSKTAAIFNGEWGAVGVMESDWAKDISCAQGVLSGITAYHTLVPYGVEALAEYEKDPVIVTAMRQACHRNLYALANSAGMNGVGEHTSVRTVTTGWVIVCRAVVLALVVVVVLFAALWHRGRTQWKKTTGYLDYRTLKRTLKEEKKNPA